MPELFLASGARPWIGGGAFCLTPSALMLPWAGCPLLGLSLLTQGTHTRTALCRRHSGVRVAAACITPTPLPQPSFIKWPHGGWNPSIWQIAGGIPLAGHPPSPGAFGRLRYPWRTVCSAVGIFAGS